MNKYQRLLPAALLTGLLLFLSLLASGELAHGGVYSAKAEDYNITLFVSPQYPAAREPVSFTVMVQRQTPPSRYLSNLDVKLTIQDETGMPRSLKLNPLEDLRYMHEATVTFQEGGTKLLRIEFQANGETHSVEFSVPILAGQKKLETMVPGMPNWLFLSSSGLVVAASFLVVELFKRSKPSGVYAKFNVLRMSRLKQAVKSRGFRFGFRLPIVYLFLFTIAAGFLGSQDSARNIAPVLTWVIWWIVLVFAIFFLGKIFCFVCPWIALSEWTRKLASMFGLKGSLNWRWPKALRNIYLATGFFVLLTWLELGYQVTRSPFATAALGVAVLSMALVPALLFERNSFCRYGCPIGRLSGLYALFSPVEVRALDKAVCRSCSGKGCLKGNAYGVGCPTYEYLGAMNTNTYCIMCSECLRTCTHDNVAFNIRPFGVDLTKSFRARKDEAYLAVIMLALTSFHGLTMIPAWTEFISVISVSLSLIYLSAFTLSMLIFLAALVGIYSGFVLLSKVFSGNQEVGFRTLFLNYAYSLLPIALFYHFAHNIAHFFTEAPKLLPAMSDPLGWGWNVFGTASAAIEPLLPLSTVWHAQIFLIVAGHIFALYVAHVTSQRVFPDKSQAFRSQIPMMVLMVFYTMFSLWLTAQPMVMKTAM